MPPVIDAVILEVKLIAIIPLSVRLLINILASKVGAYSRGLVYSNNLKAVGIKLNTIDSRKKLEQ